ncbi:MAG: hypothetical protein COW00_19410 [Bdellovibrio sp. CG12_big_fil_rev_8_21_14_0_65_39_13]|nr:MAG: hypothetical protein COW78_01480 [Bdellovibrio sp. CG22_combo_CG10-13_8_21_14_all_39_27]PIQ57729.1 MAG: hypothetical protein COW00_19410 [Bdellovibrio sp. CG12_big_fil_rev_8_21_14_0_65_39_13]PIR36541.1 MAG: hypothetical protein COV37_02555 [Bdellovibrio sp. CG11_big_fil_rev_8_21_14_0_20_39_38]
MSIHIGLYARTFHQPTIRGFSRYLLNLIEILHQLDIKITLFSDIKISTQMKSMLPNNINIIENSKQKSFVWFYYYLPKLLRKNNITHYWTPANTGIPPLICKKIKTISTIHDLISYNDFKKKFNPFLITHWLYAYQWKLSLNANFIVTVSDFSNKEIVKVSHRIDTIFTIPNLLDNNFLQNQIVPYSERKYFFYAGGFDERKNIYFLLDSFSNFEKEYHGIELLIAGGLSLEKRNELESYAKSNKIKFLGYVDDSQLKMLYSKAIATIIPSMEEGFGLQIVESALSKTPVLVSNRTSLPEVAGPDIFNFDPTNSNQLIEQMIKLALSETIWNDQLEKLIRNTKRFSSDNIKNRLDNFLKMVV